MTQYSHLQINKTDYSGKSKQPLIKIRQYLMCKHAYNRMKERVISESDLIYTLQDIDSLRYMTHTNRIILYNNITGISVIIDSKTNIIITITETDERRYRRRYQKKMARLMGNPPLLPKPITSF